MGLENTWKETEDLMKSKDFNSFGEERRAKIERIYSEIKTALKKSSRPGYFLGFRVHNLLAILKQDAKSKVLDSLLGHDEFLSQSCSSDTGQDENYLEAKSYVEQIIESLESAIQSIPKNPRVGSLKTIQQKFTTYMQDCSSTYDLIERSLATINSLLEDKKLYSLKISKSSFVNFVKQKLLQPIIDFIQKLRKDPYETQIEKLTPAINQIKQKLRTIAEKENMGIFQGQKRSRDKTTDSPQSSITPKNSVS